MRSYHLIIMYPVGFFFFLILHFHEYVLLTAWLTRNVCKSQLQGLA